MCLLLLPLCLSLCVCCCFLSVPVSASVCLSVCPLQGMELFCKELFSRGDFLELSKLATDMLHLHRHQSGPQSAVGWVAAGLYTQLKGGPDPQAMGFFDKVSEQQQQH